MFVILDKYRKTCKFSKSIDISLGEWVMIARQDQGLTQEGLGRAVGCSQALISQWETGKIAITPSDIANIARALNNPGLLQKYCAQCPVAVAMQQMSRPKPAA